MSFVPNTDSDRKEMLDRIGVSSFEELIEVIPNDVKFQGDLDLPKQLSEYEVVKLMNDYAAKNISAATHTCFMGGGAYDRFIPTIVGSVLEKPEFKTAYTPYQAEVSQGTLQAMYEFQSMICELTGMETSNASLYDGGTALAEACLLATAHNKKKDVLIAGTINPLYRKVIETLCVGRELVFSEYVLDDGTADIEALKSAVGDNTCAVIAQQPNAFGNLEDVFSIEKLVHETKALFIVSVDPSSLGLIDPPGNYNADIVVGEGQSLGIPLNFGGPYLGLFACKKQFVRKIPGRIVGVTEDTDGKRGFVLTLQTREQQIKRERATSNICTNQGLFMLAATVYMETMGKQGIQEVAKNSNKAARYLASEIAKIDGYSLKSEKPFYCEFFVNTPVPAEDIINAGIKKGILPGIDTKTMFGIENGLLIAVTEKRSLEELNDLIELLRSFSK